MKVKHIFESHDFEGSGQMIIRNSSSPKTKDLSFAASVSYKVGYSINQKDGVNFCLISLTDGMTIHKGSADNLCESLNNDECGYRPLTKEEISAIMMEVGNRF